MGNRLYHYPRYEESTKASNISLAVGLVILFVWILYKYAKVKRIKNTTDIELQMEETTSSSPDSDVCKTCNGSGWIYSDEWAGFKI